MNQMQNREEEYTHIEEPVQTTITIPETVYFDRDDVRIMKDQGITTKYKRGINGSREYDQHHFMATTTLDVEFGVAKHSPPKRCEGEVDLGNNHYKSIQEMFYGNTDKIKAFQKHRDKYDMKDVIMIPNPVNSSDYHLPNKWGGTKTRFCLLNHWSKFSLEHIAHFQKDTLD